MAGESGRLEKGAAGALSVRESVAFEFMRDYTGGAGGVGGFELIGWLGQAGSAYPNSGITPLPARGRRA